MWRVEGFRGDTDISLDLRDGDEVEVSDSFGQAGMAVIRLHGDVSRLSAARCGDLLVLADSITLELQAPARHTPPRAPPADGWRAAEPSGRADLALLACLGLLGRRVPAGGAALACGRMRGRGPDRGALAPGSALRRLLALPPRPRDPGTRARRAAATSRRARLPPCARSLRPRPRGALRSNARSTPPRCRSVRCPSSPRRSSAPQLEQQASACLRLRA